MSSQPSPQEQNNRNQPTIWETTPQNQRQQLAHLLAHLLYKQVNQALSLPHPHPAPTTQEADNEQP